MTRPRTPRPRKKTAKSRTKTSKVTRRLCSSNLDVAFYTAAPIFRNLDGRISRSLLQFKNTIEINLQIKNKSKFKNSKSKLKMNVAVLRKKWFLSDAALSDKILSTYAPPDPGQCWHPRKRASAGKTRIFSKIGMNKIDKMQENENQV